MNHSQLKTRATRVRNKLAAVAARPRLTVFRSNKHLWAQIIDDQKGITLIAANDQALKGTKTEKANALGVNLAKAAKAKKIKAVVFDRGPYRYHGRIKAVAEAAKNEGLVI